MKKLREKVNEWLDTKASTFDKVVATVLLFFFLMLVATIFNWSAVMSVLSAIR